MGHAVHDHAGITTRVDDCWNRIGTRGDGSCPRLREHTRCLNCPVFEQGAAALLDRALSDADRNAAAGADQAVALRAGADVQADTHAVLVFRIADEWLGLPAVALRQVDTPRAIHPLPHRRNGTVLGLVNIRGTLTVAVSLGDLLQLDRAGTGKHATRNACARMLVAAHRGEPAAFPVDEVEGMLRFPASALLPVPSTLTHATALHVRGVLAWRETTIGLLDADRLFDSIARSLR
ncbi:chemotaxis protein CheW [Ralstonia solanacearum]|uniref:chemotaxis protein CheW n=1 Tax=Ralstonia solanacearum TaxID=305 RepID=UPI00078D46C7|nr:chemotaxis protein CheW [Ralstonia solanacearum]AMP40497.1 chemotaxis protein CheW [Ralstonia solanacearum]AXV89356.1 chemotaxis protein CheW [Ralstonia solanacearum]AXW08819.1 chemotaxis protein CheW [Ralstonia solanacearum]AXW26603.1 chemotaxis protein CheW [Ralstonia solanacearum]AXW64720.1 chemotaxis protein CheW [Ralstonia solanacearum]